MAEEKKIDVTFINSIAIACPDKDSEVKHFQITIVQETESGRFRCYFDVVDSSKVKLQPAE